MAGNISKESLEQEIVKIEKSNQHNHSLIIIKGKNISDKERFLVYYDERWDCKLFLSYKTQDRNNEAAIIDQVCADLQLDKKELSIRYVTSRVQEKYSVSHDEYRIYNHRLYELEIHNWQKENEEDFSINEKHYYWMTIPEMEQDENIVKKNIEVVDFVKEAMDTPF